MSLEIKLKCLRLRLFVRFRMSLKFKCLRVDFSCKVFNGPVSVEPEIQNDVLDWLSSLKFGQESEPLLHPRSWRA
jgi:hypothetical protein